MTMFRQCVRVAIAMLAAFPVSAQSRSAPGDSVIAIVGATLIDGNGGPAIPNSAIVIRGIPSVKGQSSYRNSPTQSWGRKAASPREVLMPTASVLWPR